MQKKIILISPAPNARAKEPLAGPAGRRLAALANLDHAEFLDRFQFVNLTEIVAGPGEQFDLASGRARADQLRKKWRGRKIVLLGRSVAMSFRLIPEDYEWFKPVEIPSGIEAVVVPQLGGISNWWNDPDNIRSARDFMLAAKLGFFEFRRITPKTPGIGRSETFTPAQVAAALEAGRGVSAWAAEALAEATGRSVTGQTIANYIARYPDLALIEERETSRLLDFAKRNIIRDIEAGGVDSSWKLLRSRVGQGSGFELVVNAKIEGEVNHRHAHVHAHAKLAEIGLDLTRYSNEQLEAIEEFAGVLDASTQGPRPSAEVGRPGGMEPEE